MLIHGLITIQDLNVSGSRPSVRPLRSCLLTKKIGDIYFVSVKNSMYPNCINYRVSYIDQIYSKFVAEGKLGMEFKLPRHMVLVQADDVDMLAVFLRQIRDIIGGKNVVIGTRLMPKAVPPKKSLANPFDPATKEFVAVVERFDQRILNMSHLNTLILENSVLPKLPPQIGSLPIVHLSLSGSKLAESQYDRDTLWDWMTNDVICKTLTTLKMDSVGLQMLPFEILNLKKLQTLSVAKNKLTYLPQYIGELNKLHTLLVADNGLNYFPDSLFPKTFNHLDISNNPFIEAESLQFDHILCTYNMHLPNTGRMLNQSVVKSLSQLSFDSIMEHRVKFKRQDIPRSLWHYFNVVGRCVQCEKFILPDYSIVRHIISFPAAHCLTKNHATEYIQWQSLVCRFKCSKPKKK